MKRTTKVSLGLFAAWAANDLEELLTMSRNSEQILPRLPKALPIPDTLRRSGISQRHVATGIATVGLVIGKAAGRRSFAASCWPSGCTGSDIWR